MKVKVIDVGNSVFDNETEAILYVIKDTRELEDVFIFSLPVYTFSVDAKTIEELESFWNNYNLFGDPVKRKKFLNVMKKEMEEFDS